jgi:hypothetical protein
MNKYKKWYNQITNRGKKSREPGLERHHIVPKSIGGTDDYSNITFITAREHFICHWLLIKIYPVGEEHWKMLNALRMMRAENPNQKRYNTKITSRVYAGLKEEYSKLQSQKMSGENNPNFGRRWTEEQKKAHSEKIKGRKQTAEEKEKQIKAITGRKRKPFSQEWKANLSNSSAGKNNPRYGVEVSEETRKKISDKIRGRKHTEEEKKRRADAIRGSRREKQLCPHCNQSIAVNTYARWHGDNCKQNSKLDKYIVHS